MDRSSSSRKHRHFLLLCAVGWFSGCVANPYHAGSIWSHHVSTAPARIGDQSGFNHRSVVRTSNITVSSDEHLDSRMAIPNIASNANGESDQVSQEVILCADKTSKVVEHRQDSSDVVVTKVSFSGGASPKVETRIRPAQEPLWQLSQKTARLEEPFGDGTEPVHFAQRKSKGGDFISGIANAEQLVQAKVIKVANARLAMDIDMPEAYDLDENQHLILVDRAGNIQVGSISAVYGKKISIKFDDALVLVSSKGEQVRVGLLNP
jgi:hypothetical protein